MTFCSFGVTLWRSHELMYADGDTAVIKLLDNNGCWYEYLDLLSDITLPNYRKDIIRFNVSNIKGIRFDITSVIGGDWNKGRLCIDNISFTDSNLFNHELSCFTEPIVIRESFE